jgi:ATP-dependent Clp protease, protease subunit
MSLRKLPSIKAFDQTSDFTFQPPESALDAFDGSIIAAGDDENVISIFGQIGIDPFSAVDNSERRISAALRSIGKKDITVNINSPGGNFFSGIAIYNLLVSHPAKITVNVIGQAGSAASIIAMAGDEIFMLEAAFMLLHNASVVVVGNKFDTKDVTEILTEIDDAMAGVYAARADVSRSTALAWMDRRNGDGTMFNAESAVKAGLADGNLSADAVKVSAEVKGPVPAERILENSLMFAANMSPQDAKAMVAAIKSGTRDAADIVTRDADDELKAALLQLQNTIKS